MPTLQAIEAPPQRTASSSVTAVMPVAVPSAKDARKRPQASSLFLPTATASLAAHFLLIAWFGAGIPQPATRVVQAPEPAVAPVEVDAVLLAPEPEILQSQSTDEALEPALSAPEPAAALDVPALPEVQAISAVPASVPVSFGLEVKGPVRVVSDAAEASGGLGNARRALPVTLNASSEHNLLLPVLTYPPRAKRQRLTGTVWVEFRTNVTGEIVDVRVRESSGHSVLDDAAKSNLLAGRWKGQPGYYVKGFEFTLQ